MTGNVGLTSLVSAFNGCTNLTTVSGFITTSVTSMNSAFKNATNFNSDIGVWNITNVTNMNSMFSGASVFNQNIGNWNTSSVSGAGSMGGMFLNAVAFNNGQAPNSTMNGENPLNWNTANVTNMGSMFSGASVFNQYIGNWNTINVTNMISMFQNAAKFNLGSPTIDGSTVVWTWNLNSVTNMDNIFVGATHFNTDISGWTLGNSITRIVNMFANATTITNFSITNYDNLLTAWSTATPSYIPPSNFTFGANGLLYNARGAAAGLTLITSYNWTFVGDMLVVPQTEPDVRVGQTFGLTIDSNTSANFITNGHTYEIQYNSSPISSQVTAANYILNFGNCNSFPLAGTYTITLYDTTTSASIQRYRLPVLADIVCFKEGTKILTRYGYKLIQDLRKDDLIKTINHNYVPIAMIGKSKMYHDNSPNLSKDNLRSKDKLYILKKDKYPKIFEDLVITGGHSILVDKFDSDEQKETTVNTLGKIYVTDQKYRLPACVDKKAAMYENSGYYNIYHIALENDNDYRNYGIYANGLLVESCAKFYLKARSGMTLIE
jgi:hypothetical protein